jgi:hypothetical protein
MKITVYHFHYYDGLNDKSLVSKRKLSAESIKAIGKEPMPETAEEVDETALDEYGRYNPRQQQAWTCPEAPEVRSAPADVIGAAVMVGRIATGEIEEAPKPKSGRVRSGHAGAKARAESLSPEERKAIAKKASAKRWRWRLTAIGPPRKAGRITLMNLREAARSGNWKPPFTPIKTRESGPALFKLRHYPEIGFEVDLE